MLCDYFYVCPWKIGPYICLGNAEIELIKMFCLVAITSTSPKVDVTASKLVPRKEKMGS